MMRGLLASLESSTVTMEREFEVYGRLTDVGQLAKCDSFEKHSQWGCWIECEDGTEGIIRVRAIDDTLYIQTIKVKGEDGDEEVEFEVDRSAFLAIRALTEHGLVKTRYKFQMTGDLCYEVDVFMNKDGEVSEWVKVDIEIPEDGSIEEWMDKLPDLPIDLTDVRVMPPGKKSPENMEFVRELFDREFTIPRTSSVM